MFVSRNFSPKNVYNWLKGYMLWLFLYNSLIAVVYQYTDLEAHLPWLPVSVVGTAVAFFVGFKNNHAYDRMWEARKIWGAIVNDSRTFAMRITSFLKLNASENEVDSVKKRLVYRHIAWLYVHRHQLLQPMQWEQVSASGWTGAKAKHFLQKHGVGASDENPDFQYVKNFLSSEEFEKLATQKNPATQLINQQSKDLASLKEQGNITELEHLQLEELLRSFYEQQGKNERIKKFPFPRDYSNMSQFFVLFFILIFPFSLVPEMMKIGGWFVWLSVPISVSIALLYYLMEGLGDYCENPFMGTPHAIPMLSMCRTIEIDMREMLGETDLPPAIQPKNNVLM